jgi:hypothetical protein
LHFNQYWEFHWYNTREENLNFSQLSDLRGKKNTTCDASVNDNAGCGVVDWSRVSYGPQFDALGGGMYAMKWDETGISVCMFHLCIPSKCAHRLGYFYRNAIPTDLLNLNPNPSGWSQPSAFLSPDNCDLSKYFANHSIVFGKSVRFFLILNNRSIDITLCGWFITLFLLP